MRRRLAMWKRSYISKCERLTLIKATLSNQPIYMMSMFKISKSVAKRLERIQRNFIWGGGDDRRKPHLVRWGKCCELKREQGLGIRGLIHLNQALLAKQNWRFAKENTPFKRKYGIEGRGWTTKPVKKQSWSFCMEVNQGAMGRI